MSYEKFMEGKNMPFKRVVTSYLIKSLIGKNNYTFARKTNLQSISKSLFEKLEKLDNYYRQNYTSTGDSVLSAMLTVAEEHNLFDTNIYTEYLETKALLEKLTFLEPIINKMSNRDEELLFKNILCDLFKYYKVRIDYENYNISLNKEELSEEVIEGLITN